MMMDVKRIKFAFKIQSVELIKEANECEILNLSVGYNYVSFFYIINLKT